MPDDVPVYFWHSDKDCWIPAKPYMFGDQKYNYDENGNHIKNFIGIE